MRDDLQELSKADKTANYPIRYIITCIKTHGDLAGMRQMMAAAQGRNTHTTKEEADKALSALLENNTSELLQSVGYSFEVSAVKCYPNHFDPIRIF